jgi:hypothetical protein
VTLKSNETSLVEEISRKNSSGDQKGNSILQNEINFKEAIFLRDFLRARKIPVRDGSNNVETNPDNFEQFYERDFDALDFNLEIKSIPPRIYVNSNGTLIISGKWSF